MDTQVPVSQSMQSPVSESAPQTLPVPPQEQSQIPVDPSKRNLIWQYASWVIASVLIILVGLVAWSIVSEGRDFLNRNLKSLVSLLPQQDLIKSSLPIRGGIGMVEYVKLSQPGFVEVLFGDISRGNKADAIAGTVWLPAGEAFSVPLLWREDAYTSRNMTFGDMFFLAIFHDDGDRLFNPEKDTIVTLPNGNPIHVAVQVQE